MTSCFQSAFDFCLTKVKFSLKIARLFVSAVLLSTPDLLAAVVLISNQKIQSQHKNIQDPDSLYISQAAWLIPFLKFQHFIIFRKFKLHFIDKVWILFYLHILKILKTIPCSSLFIYLYITSFLSLKTLFLNYLFLKWLCIQFLFSLSPSRFLYTLYPV